MIGSFDPKLRKVTIVGAGAAGLLAAEALDRQGYEVTLFEASNRAGGLIETQKTPWGIAEKAAHSFLVTTPVRELCERIGVELIPARNRARYVLRNGKPRKFPLTPVEALHAFVRAYFVLAPSGSENLSFAHWTRRFLGEAALDFLVSPFLTGIYGANPEEILVSAAYPNLTVPPGHSLLSWQLAKKIRKKREKKEPVTLMAPRDGMGSFIDKLDRHLRARLRDRYRLGTPVRSGDEILSSVANLLLATPAFEAAKLLATHDPALSSALEKIRYTSLVATTVFARKSDFEKLPVGVGVLFSSKEKMEGLGVLFTSSSFAERIANESEELSLTVMMGGSRDPEACSASDEEIQQRAKKDLDQLFGIKRGAQLRFVIQRSPRAIPRYDADLLQAWKSAKAGWCATPGRILFGNYTGQVSLRGMIEELAGSLHA